MPFRDVAGHRQLIALLSRSVAHASLPPSLLFAGPEGIGKRMVALATAQALNCISPITTDGGVDACGTCAACTRIARNVHPDVLLIEPGDTGSISVDAVRESIARTAYRPFEGRRRVSIIDDAAAMLAPAQSALLKVLEEPPPSSVFILITSRPDMLLSTVRSRCPRLRFSPLAPADVAAVLIARGWPEPEAHAMAATAAGSVTRALEANAGEVVKSRDVSLQVLTDVAASGDSRRTLEAAKGLLVKGAGATEREQVVGHLRAMESLVRDIEVLNVNGDSRELSNTEVRRELGRLVPTFGGDRGLRAFAAIGRALAALDKTRNANPKIVADWLVLQL